MTGVLVLQAALYPKVASHGQPYLLENPHGQQRQSTLQPQPQPNLLLFGVHQWCRKTTLCHWKAANQQSLMVTRRPWLGHMQACLPCSNNMLSCLHHLQAIAPLNYVLYLRYRA